MLCSVPFNMGRQRVKVAFGNAASMTCCALKEQYVLGVQVMGISVTFDIVRGMWV
jgi:hypothetical protein